MARRWIRGREGGGEGVSVLVYMCVCVSGCLSCVQPEKVSFHPLGEAPQSAAYAAGLEGSGERDSSFSLSYLLEELLLFSFVPTFKSIQLA